MLRSIAAALVLAAAAATAPGITPVAFAQTSPVDGLAVCQYEDGNPDAQPCVWTDPDTGRLYFNDGANYR